MPGGASGIDDNRALGRFQHHDVADRPAIATRNAVLRAGEQPHAIRHLLRRQPVFRRGDGRDRQQRGGRAQQGLAAGQPHAATFPEKRKPLVSRAVMPIGPWAR